MADKAVELSVAGQSCRVVTTADEQELQALAAMVEDKLSSVLQPGRPVTTRAMLLAAVALAHDVQEQRARADAIAAKAKSALKTLLKRVDTALKSSDERTKERTSRSKRSAKAKAPAKGERSKSSSKLK